MELILTLLGFAVLMWLVLFGLNQTAQQGRRLFRPNPTHPFKKPRKAPRTADDETVAQLKRIDELTKTARTSWFGQLSYFAFVGVALLGVEDADFYFADRQTDLPLIGIGIPTYLFFSVAPVLGAVLFAYFHQHLLKLWEALGEADATVDGQPLSDRIQPWLVSDLALAYRRDKALRPRPMQILAHTVSILLAYYGAPVLLVLFWWRSFASHNELTPMVFAGPSMLIAFFVAYVSWRRMRECARQGYRARLITRVISRLTLRGFASVVFVFAAFGWIKTEGEIYPYVDWGYDQYNRFAVYTHKEFGWTLKESRYRTIGEQAWWADLPFDALLANVDLAGERFVELPEGWRDYQTLREEFRVSWCKDRGIAPEVCGPAFTASDPDDAHQEIANVLQSLREEWCKILPKTKAVDSCATYFQYLNSAFAGDWSDEYRARLVSLPKRPLIRTDFRRADLSEAVMPGLDLEGARFSGADLSNARLEAANLSSARMQEVRMFEARLESANLRRARIERSDLIGARMEGADLRGARLEGANLREARMEGAILRAARMEGANLISARLEGADLTGARMEGADLFSARMEGSIFSASRFNGMSDLRAETGGAALRSVDFSGVDVPDDFVAAAFGDGSVTGLPDHLRPGEKGNPLEHWPATALEIGVGDDGEIQDMFIDAWRAWQRKQGYDATE